MVDNNNNKLRDEEIVELVRNGNKEFYTEIVQRYQAKLLRYVTYLIQDRESASDVVQDAFIKAFVNLWGFDTKRKFSSWIYRITHNEAINYLKKQKREILIKDKVLEGLVDTRKQPEDEFNHGELKKMIKECLEELPIKYRSPLVLFFLEAKSYEEISDTLRIPIGTIGTRINRGKKLIQRICKKNGGRIYVNGAK